MAISREITAEAAAQSAHTIKTVTDRPGFEAGRMIHESGKAIRGVQERDGGGKLVWKCRSI